MSKWALAVLNCFIIDSINGITLYGATYSIHFLVVKANKSVFHRTYYVYGKVHLGLFRLWF